MPLRTSIKYQAFPLSSQNQLVQLTRQSCELKGIHEEMQLVSNWQKLYCVVDFVDFVVG